MAVWPLAAEISWDCGNFQLEAVHFSLICYVKLKYYGNFNHIIVDIFSVQFAKFFNSQETCLRKVLDFSHVFGCSLSSNYAIEYLDKHFLQPFVGLSCTKHVATRVHEQFFNFSCIQAFFKI